MRTRTDRHSSECFKLHFIILLILHRHRSAKPSLHNIFTNESFRGSIGHGRAPSRHAGGRCEADDDRSRNILYLYITVNEPDVVRPSDLFTYKRNTSRDRPASRGGAAGLRHRRRRKTSGGRQRPDLSSLNHFHNLRLN